MKVIIAPDSFKGSLSSYDAARAIERGIHKVLPDAETVIVTRFVVNRVLPSSMLRKKGQMNEWYGFWIRERVILRNS